MFVICAPTALGKTEIAYTVGHAYARHAHMLVPTNVLVDQTIKRYPKLDALYRMSYYRCTIPDHKPSCRCKYDLAKDRVRAAPMGVMNYWSCLFNKLHRPVMIFDECHKVVDMLTGLNDIHLLQRDYDFPARFAPDMPYDTVGDLLDWCHEYLQGQQDARIEDAVLKLTCLYRKHALLRHRGEVTVVPLSVEAMGRLLWPKDVQKIIMMSATTGPMDIKELGLDGRRVCYLQAPSPIPPKNRPLIYKPRFNLAYHCVHIGLPILAAELLKLLDKHPDKGLCHLPYNLALKLQTICDHPRLIFHTKSDKAEKLAEFRNAPPESGMVLVASGMFEGVDLPYDAARWQLIGKIPFASLGDPLVKARMEEDPEWYGWNTAKKLLQAYGRIVRTPTDFGETYIMDTAWGSFYQRNYHLIPAFVKAAYREER